MTLFLASEETFDFFLKKYHTGKPTYKKITLIKKNKHRKTYLVTECYQRYCVQG